MSETEANKLREILGDAQLLALNSRLDPQEATPIIDKLHEAFLLIDEITGVIR